MNEISVNGVTTPLEHGATVIDIVRSLTTNPNGCAVAVNDSVVPRSDWPNRTIDDGDRVEVLTAVQGG